MYEKEIGKKLQQLRRRKKLTQENIGDMIGLTTHHVSALERGMYAPSLETLILYMNAIECSGDELFSCVLNEGYKHRSSQIEEKLAELPPAERNKILDVLEVMIANATKNKPKELRRSNS